MAIVHLVTLGTQFHLLDTTPRALLAIGVRFSVRPGATLHGRAGFSPAAAGRLSRSHLADCYWRGSWGLKNNRTTAGLLHPFITIVWLIERGGAPR